MKRGLTRRQFLATTAKAGAASALVGALPLGSLGPWIAEASGDFLTNLGLRPTLEAALARMIPRSGTNDWSAADVGAGNYIERLLSADLDIDPAGGIFAGGPYRHPDPPNTTSGFSDFQTLSRVKREGWKKEIARLRTAYVAGLQELNERAHTLGAADFAHLGSEEQDAILTLLDLEDPEGTHFFAALYAHTMEAVYGHPVYRASDPQDPTTWDYRPWDTFCYPGDVHGVRFPDGKNADGNAWNVFGGYSPEEMGQPGTCEKPVKP